MYIISFFKKKQKKALNYFVKLFFDEYQHYNIDGYQAVSNVILKEIQELEK